MFLSSEDNMEDTEAVTRSSSVEKVLLKIAQNYRKTSASESLY